MIHVYPNQFMMLVDGGKVVDYTAEEGYYQVENAGAPSLFGGQFGEALEESFRRINMAVYRPARRKYILSIYRRSRESDLAHGIPLTISITPIMRSCFCAPMALTLSKSRIPLRFYAEAVPRNRDRVEIEDINEQYFSEFMEALQAAINQMSADGVRISYVPSKGRELSRYMSSILDEDWKPMRGIEVQSVGIASISYDEESQKLIQMRNQGAMLSDASIREGYVQGQWPAESRRRAPMRTVPPQGSWGLEWECSPVPGWRRPFLKATSSK